MSGGVSAAGFGGYYVEGGCRDDFRRISSETDDPAGGNTGATQATQAASDIFLEDATMKLNRVIAFFAVLLIAGFVTWAFAREHVGAQESQAIEAGAP